MAEYQKIRPVIEPFSEKEIAKILKTIQAKDPWYGYYFRFALLTGMRRSEILSLTWNYVDMWLRKEITVPKARHQNNQTPSARRIPITPELLTLLLDLRSPSKWVFQKTGKRMLGQTVSLFFRELSRDLGIYVNSERIRWTFAMRAYQQIAPSTAKEWKQLQHILGHRDGSTTKSYFLRNLNPPSDPESDPETTEISPA